MDAYFEYGRTGQDDVFWAWQEVNAEGWHDPESKWILILELIAAAPDDHQLGLLAAGPLEDLLTMYGSVIIERIEGEVERNPRLREALGGVWVGGDLHSADVADRVARLVNAG